MTSANRIFCMGSPLAPDCTGSTWMWLRGRTPPIGCAVGGRYGVGPGGLVFSCVRTAFP